MLFFRCLLFGQTRHAASGHMDQLRGHMDQLRHAASGHDMPSQLNEHLENVRHATGNLNHFQESVNSKMGQTPDPPSMDMSDLATDAIGE